MANTLKEVFEDAVIKAANEFITSRLPASLELVRSTFDTLYNKPIPLRSRWRVFEGVEPTKVPQSHRARVKQSIGLRARYYAVASKLDVEVKPMAIGGISFKIIYKLGSTDLPDELFWVEGGTGLRARVFRGRIARRHLIRVGGKRMVFPWRGKLIFTRSVRRFGFQGRHFYYDIKNPQEANPRYYTVLKRYWGGV